MCGICGEIDFQQSSVEPTTIAKMCSVLSHRGPDDKGILLGNGNRFFSVEHPEGVPTGQNKFEVGLGHRRLSIIDLSPAAHQPMSNEDRSIWIVFNGEIYNFMDLRKELEARGHVFRSRSDTEVILHAYETWDVECLQRFRGMFAFAIWDSTRRRLFLARDRLGKKPLVYFHRNGRFFFASEIKAVLQANEIERKVDSEGLHNYLTFQYVPSPQTIFEGIKKLPPAHFLLFDPPGKIKTERYWQLQIHSNPKDMGSETPLCERIRHELEESVRIRLISDVPLGAFLSGGIDSSIVVGLMAKLSGNAIKTFSIGFEEKDFDELPYARLIAKHFSTDHHEFIVKPNAIEILPKLVWYYNEPFADASAIPTYYVAKVTKDYVKVVLTGDAGDENFAGYPRYLRSKMVAWFTQIPEVLRKSLMPDFARFCSSFGWKERAFNRLADLMEFLSGHQGRNYAEQVKIFNTKEKLDLYTDDFANQVQGIDSLDYLARKYDEGGSSSLIDNLLYVDIHSYLPEDLLVKMDIATMANSLEARVPFLDHRFMEFVAGIPSDLKLRGFKTKFILKKAFSDFLPEAILQRKKMGFGVPVSQWFRNELKDYVYEILLDSRTLKRGYFKREGIERLLNEHLLERYDRSTKIWALLVLEIWFRVFMDGACSCFAHGA